VIQAKDSFPLSGLANGPFHDDARFDGIRDIPVVFMFPGGGAQYPGMGRDLYEEQTVFRSCVDECAHLALNHLGTDIREALYHEFSSPSALERPSVALVALFITEYALAKLWMSLGVKASAMIGHSLGEYVAACMANVFSLDDALRLVALRGQLFERVGVGAMLSVPLASDIVETLLTDNLSLAAINAPDLCVVSGLSGDVDRFEEKLTRLNVEVRRIPIAVPGHSALLDPVLDDFLCIVAQVAMHRPSIPFVSNLTGTWITDAEAVDPAYWAGHLRGTVHFSKGIRTLFMGGYHTFLEVGPGRALSSLTTLHDFGEEQLVVASMPRKCGPNSDTHFLLASFRQLAFAGLRSRLASPPRKQVQAVRSNDTAVEQG
jgi:phthiocerol/phenolphthiocerol synthesis type-I polyketide synthase E